MPLVSVIDPAEAAEQLRADVLHVWRLSYDARHRRAPLRALLGAYLGVPGDAVALTDDAHGRPRLALPRHGGLDFNWSHSGDCALVAIGRDIMPGVDVERRRERPQALAIARRYFSADEAAWLASLVPVQRTEAFLALWTAKEAVLKALGRGLAFGLHRLHIASDAQGLRLCRLEGDDAAAWQLERLSIDAEHVAALAWRGPPRTIAQWTLAEAR